MINFNKFEVVELFHYNSSKQFDFFELVKISVIIKTVQSNKCMYPLHYICIHFHVL